MTPKNRMPTLPGEVLRKEFLEPAGISQRKLAKHIGMTTETVNRIVNGHQSITPLTALRLSKALGTTPEFWLFLQDKIDLYRSSVATE